MKEDRQHTFSERGEEGKGEQKHVKPPKGRGWKKERESKERKEERRKERLLVFPSFLLIVFFFPSFFIRQTELRKKEGRES